MSNIEGIGINLLMKEPFFGHFLTHFQKKYTEKVGTVALSLDADARLTLLINKTYWDEKLTAQPLKDGVLKHQLLHLVFQHLDRSVAFPNDELFDIAADLTINQYLAHEQLTENALQFRDFAELNLQKNQSLAYYYDALLSLLIETKYDGTVAKKRLQKILNEGSEALEQHAQWRKKTDAGTQRLLQNQVIKALQTAFQRYEQNKTVGTLPKGILLNIEQQLAAAALPVADWRRLLRLFTQRSRKTFIKSTLRHPSKRYGTTPGIAVEKRYELLVAIDTSASISVEKYDLFFEEIWHIKRQGATITVVECDTEIQQIYNYKGETPPFVKGQGGTQFDAPIRFANEGLRPDALIYFTDGKAPPPTLKSRCPLLWVVETAGKLEVRF